jgi:hypothetical protein
VWDRRRETTWPKATRGILRVIDSATREGERAVAFLVKFGVSMVAGLLVGTLTTVGLVYSQTRSPSDNPADQPILTYGDQS